MAIERVQGFHYACDGPYCGVSHYQANADSHYHNSTPPGWVRVNIHPAEGPSRQYILCPQCQGLPVTRLMSPRDENLQTVSPADSGA